MTFEAFFESKRSALFRYALKLTKDWETAQDLVQDTAFRAAASWKAADPQKNPTSWVYMICKRRWLDTLRKRRCRPVIVEIQDFGDHEQSLIDPAPFDALGEEWAYKFVVDTLGSDSALFLDRISGEQVRDLAKRYGVAEGTVKSKLFRLRTKLAKAWDSQVAA